MSVQLHLLLMITRLAALSTLALLSFTVLCNFMVAKATNDAVYSNLKTLPYNQVGVLLGTSKYSRLGGSNDHYRLRVNAAYQLYQAGKIDYILISGDNSTRFYDEPSTIRRDLLKKGIPPERIYRDYAGFRTLDSILRAHHVFGLENFTIISQAPHNKRALYIAMNHGIDAIAYNAGAGNHADINNKAREVLARVLTVLEVHFFNTGPKFLGPTIEISVTPPT